MSRRLAWRDVACPFCGTPRGKLCRRLDDETRALTRPHRERIWKAELREEALQEIRAEIREERRSVVPGRPPRVHVLKRRGEKVTLCGSEPTGHDPIKTDLRPGPVRARYLLNLARNGQELCPDCEKEVAGQ